MSLIIQITNYGNLSKFIQSRLKTYTCTLEGLCEISLAQSFLVLTYSCTLHSDTINSYNQEIEFYKKVIQSAQGAHIIFISSQTVELTSLTFYSKAKLKIEELLKSSTRNYTILRLGMLFDADKKKYTLAPMNKSANSRLTFYQDLPKTTVCTLSDVADAIKKISSHKSDFQVKSVNLGIKKYTFVELQDIAKTMSRVPLLHFYLLRLFSILTLRLKAYTGGGALSQSPNYALRSSYVF